MGGAGRERAGCEQTSGHEPQFIRTQSTKGGKHHTTSCQSEEKSALSRFQVENLEIYLATVWQLPKNLMSLHQNYYGRKPTWLCHLAWRAQSIVAPPAFQISLPSIRLSDWMTYYACCCLIWMCKEKLAYTLIHHIHSKQSGAVRLPALVHGIV